MNGIPGLFVITPLLLEGRAEAVLVQRGWVQRNFVDRAALPAVKTPPGIVDVSGSIAPPPSRLIRVRCAGERVIRQNVDIDAFSGEIGLPLLPMSVLQSETGMAEGDGLSRRWPILTLDVQKHYGYAFQWSRFAP
jgi:surfeit locus 1 family protein